MQVYEILFGKEIIVNFSKTFIFICKHTTHSYAQVLLTRKKIRV